ncbi:glycosyltransferase family 4 protein [Pseudomonas sp. R5(2019)]|uniref:glycosyltransferase family 4 protein n=1 Tax=Pseudomonas sp. R5(2019) TaxID=2697566 RepID=UPI001C499BDC|nr:glycosyltransferase family 4 protein [Pseudomonas sp. R5(2019)]
MKVAIIHDWLVTIAGAEKVLAAILEIYPAADLYSIVDFLSEDQRRQIGGKVATTSFIQKLPKAKSMYRNYLPLMPLAVEQFDLSTYDLVISSSHAVAKGVITGPDQLHICYCHSPIRYAWDLQAQYLKESRLDRGLKSWIARILLQKIRNWDFRTSNGVDHFISNSDYIARRIWKVYRRNATTIHPNVSVNDFSLTNTKDEFYLTASRMVPYKKMDLIVQAFSLMPDKKLIVIGDGPQMDVVRQSATQNITIMGYQPFSVLRDHMQRAKAFVFAAEEDFGIIPVEAQACGTPVIAFAKGGALETVIEGKTGIFFEEQTKESIQEAVIRFEQNFTLNTVLIRNHAENFSSSIFREKFEKFVVDCIAKKLNYSSDEIKGIEI